MTVSCGGRDDGRRARRRRSPRTASASPSRRAGRSAARSPSGRSGIRRLGDGPVRDAVLQVRYVSAAGEVVKAGGPTVKNVSGFDLCRLLVGSRGTLGFIGDVILRTRPRAPLRAVVPRCARSRSTVLASAVPAGVGPVGRHDDVGAARGRRARRRRRGGAARPVAGRRPAGRCRPAGAGRSRPQRIRELTGTFVAEVGVGDRPPRRRRRRREPSTRRSSSCTGGSRSASTRPAGSTPASIRSMADPTAARRGTRRRGVAASRTPELLRSGMNAIFVAGEPCSGCRPRHPRDRARRRAHRGRRARAGARARRSVRRRRPRRDGVGARRRRRREADWREVGRMVAIVHALPRPCPCRLPRCDEFPWWQLRRAARRRRRSRR